MGFLLQCVIMQDAGGGKDAVPPVPRWNTPRQVEGTPERLCQQVSMHAGLEDGYVSLQYLSTNQPHCSKNPIYVFPEKELRGLSPNFHIHTVCL
jgi:hypothetical protein